MSSGRIEMTNKWITYFLSWSLMLALVSCKEDTISEGILPLREPATTDPTGGRWRTIILRSAADVSVPQPVAVASPDYQRELTAVKNGLTGITADQLTAISYWSDGGVLRWNQIARQLVAKYNVAPAYNELTGQFTPFNANSQMASPPYAARVLALLSAAQYDALVVTWRAKYQYNRPSLASQNIATQGIIADLPSYPSEDAAVAEASYRMLAYFFPNEAAWLKAKAAEHKQSRISAGANVASDLKAGEDLAATVVTKVMAYAQSDRFVLARDPNNAWLSLLANAPYDVKWTSLEIPARPPTLPLAGRVRLWFDSTTIARTALVAPPRTSSAEFQKALTEVRDLAATRTREQWRIADYWSDGLGTYTLPGHWNYLTEELVREDRQNELRTARTYALLNRAMHDGMTASWLAKYTYFVPRPSQVDATIRVAAEIPNYPAYVAEHATGSAAAATVLSYLFPDNAASLGSQASEAALSRLYGGLHYRFDLDAGIRLGNSVGKLATDWAKTDGAN